VKSISSLSFSKKIVFLRTDFNVPISDGSISDSKRVDEVIPTILSILNNGNKLVICSHLGRPNGTINNDLSLKIVCEYLELKLPDRKIHFVSDVLSDYHINLDASNFGEIVFLENIRFYSDEERNSVEFKKFLKNGIDIYCNEAFSCSHRAHSSIMMAEYFDKDSKFCGLLFKKEVDSINDFILSRGDNIKSTAVIGGGKISTKLPIIENLQLKVNTILIVGAMANTIFHYQGYNVGRSLFENNCGEMCEKILNNDKCKVFLPIDVIVTDNISNPTRIENKVLSEVRDDDIIVDAGAETIEYFFKILDNSNSVLWNGPLGLFEIKPFDVGTIEFAKRVIKLTESGKIKSVIGGGDTLSALKDFDLSKFSHASTAGGAFLEYIELNGRLVGIRVLEEDSSS
jgi:phosphoglycerate kinase